MTRQHDFNQNINRRKFLTTTVAFVDQSVFAVF